MTALPLTTPAPAPPAALADPPPWTCPFCSLHCDSLALRPAADGAWQLDGTDCPRALAGLAHLPSRASTATPLVRGQQASLDEALDAAAALLAARQAPLVGGWASDILGARALFRLTARLGAVGDHAHGETLTTALRAQQDRGGYTTTLAEVRERADLLLCIGTQPSEHYPEFFRRCAVGEPINAAPRRIVFLGAPVDPALAADTTESLPLHGDLFDTLSLLEALLAQRPVRQAPAALATLAQQLRDAHYPVLVVEAAALPPHGALVFEAVSRLVNLMNLTGRAAMISLGGSDGGYSAQQAHTWLAGLPLRTRFGPTGLDHDPLRHSTARLLGHGEADALVWAASITPDDTVPETTLPRVVFAHPALPVPTGEVVFIPVATPGIGSGGQLYRSDGTVIVPLHPVIDQGLPALALVIDALLQRLEGAVRAPGRPQPDRIPSGDRSMYPSNEGSHSA